MSVPMRPPVPSSQAGSAYLAVLLVLVILTIMGLSLATITSLEVEVGSAERSITRVFYGADSGIAIATASALTTRDYRARELRLFGDTRSPSGTSNLLTRAYRVQLTHTVPLLAESCNLSSVNENEQQFFRVNHAMVSTASEQTWVGDEGDAPGDLEEARRHARKVVSVMIDAQCIWPPPTESIDLDAEETSKIVL